MRNLRNIHHKSMKKLRNNLQKNIKIIYSDGHSVIVNCTVSDQNIDLMKYSEFVGKDYKVFNVLINDLMEINGYLTGFDTIIYDRVKYQVQHKLVNNVFNTTIRLVGVVYRNDIN